MTALAFTALAPAAAARDPDGGDANARALAAVACALAEPELRAQLDAHERARSYPRDVLAELRAAGLASVFAEARATAFHLAHLNALAASVSGSLAISVGVNSLALLPLYIAGTEAQCAHVLARVDAGASLALLLTEWDRGSDLVRNTARADAIDGGFRLTGAKHLINGGGEHELLVCLLRTRAAAERDALAAASDFTMFLVERGPRVRATRRHRTLPCAAADISDVELDGATVGADAVIGGLGEGFTLVHRTLSISRGGVGALASGAASAARELAETHAGARVLYGKPIAELGAIGEHLAHVRALDLAAAALAVKQAAVVNALGPGAAYATAVAKVACTAFAEDAVGEGRRVLGARALVDGPYERLVRDVLLYGVFDGTTHVMLEELHWRLAQLAVGARDAPASTLAELARIYATPPRTLRDAARSRVRVRVPPIAAHLDELARVSRDPSLAHAAELARELLAAVGELRRTGAWERDQAVRFAGAHALVQLEAIAAVAELADPACRAALALEAPPPHVAREAPHALAWLGTRVAAAVRALAYRADSATAAIERAERALHAAHRETAS